MTLKIKEIRQTCSAFPSQWEIKLNDGRMVYVRYRWGHLSMNISEKPTDNIYDAVDGYEIYENDKNDNRDVMMSIEQMLPILEKALLSAPAPTKKEEKNELLP